MTINLLRAPLILGAVISGGLVLFAIAALVTSSPRWDDHLLNAIGVFIAGVFVSLTLGLTIVAFRVRGLGDRPCHRRRGRVVDQQHELPMTTRYDLACGHAPEARILRLATVMAW